MVGRWSNVQSVTTGRAERADVLSVPRVRGAAVPREPGPAGGAGAPAAGAALLPVHAADLPATGMHMAGKWIMGSLPSFTREDFNFEGLYRVTHLRTKLC